MGVNRDSVTVHIETLVLLGFPSGSRQDIGDALQAELVRLLVERGSAGVVAGVGRDAVIDGGSFTLPARADARASGTGIARRVYASLARGGDHERS